MNTSHLETNTQTIDRLTKELDGLRGLYRNVVNHGLELTAENADLRAKLLRAEAAVGEWEEREASCCPENTSFVDVIKTLRSEKGRAEACGAEMRSNLEAWKAYWQSSIPKNGYELEESGERFTDAWFHMDRVLSSDCGKGWISPEESHELNQSRNRLKVALEFAAKAYDDERTPSELASFLYEVSCVARKALETEGK